MKGNLLNKEYNLIDYVECQSIDRNYGKSEKINV